MPPKKHSSRQSAKLGEPDVRPPAVTRLLENPFAPEYRADETQSVSLVNGVICVAFATGRYDYASAQPHLKRVVTLRLVMPVEGVRNCAIELHNLLDQQKDLSGTVSAAVSAPSPSSLQAVELVEDLYAPELYASGSKTIIIVAGMVGVTFVSMRGLLGPTGVELCEAVSGRLVFTLAAARGFVDQVYAFLDLHGLGAKPRDATSIQ